MQCATFEEALDLAARGDNKNVDKLVRDIYGGDYDRFVPDQLLNRATPHQVWVVWWDRGFQLRADEHCRESWRRFQRGSCTSDPHDDHQQHWRPRQALLQERGHRQVASIQKHSSPQNPDTRVVFVGNFLRINTIAMRSLSTAMEYWSKGTMKALFCEHEVDIIHSNIW